MINWKALVAGILAILVLGLIMQLGFLLTATWLTVIKNQDQIGPQSLQLLKYSAGFVFASFTLIPGGYLTAQVCKIRVSTHCAIVGILATMISLATSPGSEHATIKGAVFVILGTGMVMLGGVLWKWMASLGDT